VAYSPDGKRIVSASADSTLKVWDVLTGQALLSLKGHSGHVHGVAFSPDGNRIVSAGGELERPGEVKVWSAQQEQDSQRMLRANVTRDFHSAQAEAAERLRQPFAAVFHLDRLLPLLPAERSDLLARRHDVLTAALKKTPGDLWATRALARQAIADPATIPERATLLALRAALAKQQHAPNDRLYGAVLLRTGSAREAALVLRAARNKRGPDAAPVEELLLALAHAQLKQPAEARKHLQTAVAAMQRLDSLDQQTAYELKSLRAAAETALAGQH
jgi:hypothetical protein